MTYLIGIDEAGYGPRLGPLVVTASVWQVARCPDELDLYARLAPHVTSLRAPTAGRGARRISAATATTPAAGGPLLLADSKKVYRSGDGLHALELGVLASLRCVAPLPATRGELLHWLDPSAAEPCAAQPWLAAGDMPLPRAARRADIDYQAERLRAAQQAAGVRLCTLRSRIVFPAEFNQLVARWDSKAAALSGVSLELAVAALSPLPDAAIRVVCDKHGGRNSYAPLLMSHFPEALVETRLESTSRSHYTCRVSGREIDVHFAARGESHLEVALASMVAKYVRELVMEAFNAFWLRQVPGLRPTAGYPADAERFRRDIAHRRQQLGLAETLLWRQR
jgi:hypothetical protein